MSPVGENDASHAPRSGDADPQLGVDTGTSMYFVFAICVIDPADAHQVAQPHE
jgi:hypothetical protein